MNVKTGLDIQDKTALERNFTAAEEETFVSFKESKMKIHNSFRKSEFTEKR